MEDNPTTEANDGSTLAIGILHMVDVLGSLHTFLFHPRLDGLPQPRHIHETAKRAQSGDSLLYSCLILSRALAEFRHLRERGVRHFGHQNSRRKSVFNVVRLEALPHGPVRAEHRPIIRDIHDSGLCGIRVIVLSPLTEVKAQTVNIVFATPRASTIRLC